MQMPPVNIALTEQYFVSDSSIARCTSRAAMSWPETSVLDVDPCVALWMFFSLVS